MDPNTLVEFLKRNNAFWQWEGHKHVAQLTSGKLSDFFANLSPIFTDPKFQDRVGAGLADMIGGAEEARRFKERENKWVVGSAMGAIGLAQSLARKIGARAAFTEPVQIKALQLLMQLKRFDLGEKPTVFLVEDVLTTGGTTARTVEGILVKHPDAVIFPHVLVVVNRSGSREGFTIAEGNLDGQIRQALTFDYYGILEVEPKVWDTVADLPPHMQQCVPIRPKGNWEKLTTDMSL
jgi:orotate phosphoribosyltransferase